MIDLSILFTDHFDDRQHSDAELLSYTTQHLALTGAAGNNPLGVFNGIIGSTTTLLASFATCVGDKTFNAGVRKAANLGKADFKRDLPERIGRAAAAVEAAFGKGSTDFMACFPNGRTGVTQGSEDLLRGKLQALLAALTARAAATGLADQVTVVTGLVTTWTALLASADLADGTESGSAEQRKACRKALTAQLWRNALTIALQFDNRPEKAAVYLPQQLLRNPTHTAAPPTATLTSGYAGGLAVPLTMEAEGAEEFILARRMVGEVDFTDLATVPAEAEGQATYNDTLPGPGHFEYQCRAANDAGEGAVSNVVLVAAD